MMVLSAIGRLDAMTTFARPLDLKGLRLYPPQSLYERDRFQESLAFLRARGADPRLQATLEAMLTAEGRPSLRGG